MHGLPAETWQLVRATGLTTYEGADKHWILEEDRRLREADDFWDRLDSVLGRLNPRQQPDTTFDAFAATCCKLDARARRALPLARAYVEGFNAADASRISVRSLAESQQASEKIQGNRLFRLLHGYDGIVDALHSHLDPDRVRISLGMPVKTLRWDGRGVEAITVTPTGTRQTFRARRAIVTLPLSILQASIAEPAAVEF